jgi:hypothetical protein
MVVGLILVPLATGGAVLLAKSSNPSAPASNATISLPIGEDTSGEHSPSEGSGFVLAPSEETAAPRDLKQQQSEEQEQATPQPNSSEQIDSDEAAAEVLFASDSTNGDVADGEQRMVAHSGRNLLNSYAFANARSSGGGSGPGTRAHPVQSTPASDAKTPQSSPGSSEEPSETTETDPVSDGQDSSETNESDVRNSGPKGDEGSGGDDVGSDRTHPNTNDTEPGDVTEDDATLVDELPVQEPSVPYFPPVDERPHVSVPEPSTLMLMGLGLLACAAASRRRRIKQQ